MFITLKLSIYAKMKFFEDFRFKRSLRDKVAQSKSEKAVMIVICVLMSLYALSLVVPFFFLVINSFKDDLDWLNNPLGFSTKPTIDTYIFVFEELRIEGVGLGEMFLNSVLLSAGLTVFSMALTTAAAYVLAKYQFKGNKLIYSIVLISSMFPTIAALPATYRFMQQTHLLNTYIGMLLLQGGAFGGAFLYLHAYFKQIPWDYAESAMIDGASDFKIFVRIMIPLAKNGIITFTITRFLGFWNDYWYPSLFYNEHPTLAVGLSLINEWAFHQLRYTEMFAAMVITIIPVLVFYAIFQKQLLSNTVDGGIKS